MPKLKDGSTVEDPRLGRLVQYDERSKLYPIRALVGEKPLRSYTWRLNTYLDQGYEGACVGFSWAHELVARPVELQGLDNQAARQIYFDAQKLDEWEGGAYPNAAPFYEGTSVIAGAKAVQAMGKIKEYRWAFSLYDALLAIGYQGPGILGCNWYEGMMKPNEKGYIERTGRIIGGHAIVVRGVDLKNKRVRLSNSWGKTWGVDGDCWMYFWDFEYLLMHEGEFCIPVGRSK